jgi:hydrogenase maturation protein HypF
VAYEGQAAVELEAASDEDFERQYPFEIRDVDGVMQFPSAPIIRSVVDDVHNGVALGRIGATFHNTLVALFSDVCERIREMRGLDRVALSGGCFQNKRLLVHLSEALEGKGFHVYSQATVPSNDGGISLGQAIVADAIVKAAKA